MWRAALNLRRLVDRELAPLGLHARIFGLMALLARGGPQSQRAIGEICGVDRSSMVGFLDELEALGYARRERDAADRRAHRIALTSAGRRALARALRAAGAVEARVWPRDGGGARQRARFQAELRRIAELSPPAAEGARRRRLAGPGSGGSRDIFARGGKYSSSPAPSAARPTRRTRR